MKLFYRWGQQVTDWRCILFELFICKTTKNCVRIKLETLETSDQNSTRWLYLSKTRSCLFCSNLSLRANRNAKVMASSYQGPKETESIPDLNSWPSALQPLPFEKPVSYDYLQAFDRSVAYRPILHLCKHVYQHQKPATRKRLLERFQDLPAKWDNWALHLHFAEEFKIHDRRWFWL